MSLTLDLNSLVRRPLPENRLEPVANPAAIRAKTGLERKLAGTANSVNSQEVTVTSTDGLFTFTVDVLV